MSNAKVLFLLLSLVVFVNYINYLMPDRDKLHKQIELLSYKIDKENKLNQKKLDTKQLQLPLDTLFYDGKKFNYSQAMGDFQESISNAAKDVCILKYIKWAQVPLSTNWYDHLKINTSLECTPKDMFLFINKLRKNEKLYNIKNFTIYRMPSKPMLQINMQLIAYRMHHEK
jgi:hypothetical protein